MKTSAFSHRIVPFIGAVAVAVAWGSVVQTHYNLQALVSLGVEIDGSVRGSTTLRDLFGGFSPTYGGYVVAPALLVAFLVAGAITRAMPRGRIGWFTLAGFLGVVAAIPLVNYLAPVALLVGASREPSSILWMAVGGALAGLLFSLATGGANRARRAPSATIPPPDRAGSSVPT